MNLIPKVTEMLGLSYGEIFRVKEDGLVKFNPLRFTDKGLEYLEEEGKWLPASCSLQKLLNGELEIWRIPYEPKEGDVYWTVIWSRGARTKGIETIEFEWLDDYNDHLRKALNMVYRTEKEADDDKYDAFERVTKKRWDDWPF